MPSAGKKVRPLIKTLAVVRPYSIIILLPIDYFFLQGSSGHEVLSNFINGHRSEYYALSEDAKDSLVKEYEEYKTMKTTGVRISSKSKINDITQTLKVIEHEVHFYYTNLRRSIMS